MTAIPKQVAPTLRKFIKKMPCPYEVRSSKSHYFLYINGERVCCIGNNSSSSRQKVTYQRSTMAEISNFLRERLAIDYRA